MVGVRQSVHGCYYCSQRVRFSECAFYRGSALGRVCTIKRRSAHSALLEPRIVTGSTTGGSSYFFSDGKL